MGSVASVHVTRRPCRAVPCHIMSSRLVSRDAISSHVMSAWRFIISRSHIIDAANILHD